MTEKPICEIPNCKNEAMFVINNKKICGSCYKKYIMKVQKQNWEDIEDACR